MSVTLDHLLDPLGHWLGNPSVEDVLVNAPDNIWTFERGAYKRHEVRLDADDIEDIAIVAAAQLRQNIHHDRPLLSIAMNNAGEAARRLQAVFYPCVPQGRPCLVIRRGSSDWPTMKELASKGLFKRAVAKRQVNRDEDLLQLYRDERFDEFLALAVRRRRTIIACGQTASGKTTLSKALIGEIPLEDRLIVIEDAQELLDLPHQNSVALFCKKDPKEGDITATQLVDAALRMRIGRLFMQEIRDGNAANAFMIALQTGHTGAITTIHASDCAGVFNRLRVLISQTPEGRGVRPEDVTEQLKAFIDVVIHLTLDESGERHVDEVWFKDADME